MIAASAWAQAPVLQHAAAYQSPVRAAAGDLLLLPGANLSADARVTFIGAGGAPRLEAPVERSASNSNALVVSVPAGVDARAAYALEVVAPDGASARIAINDPRPAWFLPRRLPADGAPAGGPRELRIVGRNLAPMAGVVLQIALRGATEIRLPAAVSPDPGLDEFVVTAAVPALAPGDYRVAVSRDGIAWAELADTLSVVPVAATTALDVSAARFGGCRPDDLLDDSRCVIAALAAARATAARVRFAPGRWRIDAVGDGAPVEDGLLVPRGVGLVGDTAAATEIVRGAAWQGVPRATLFTLEGDNVVRGLSFVDGAEPRAADDGAFLQIGRRWNAAGDARGANDVVITQCRFAGASEAIRDGGLPLRGLVITDNLIRARHLGLSLGGSAFNTRDVFRIADSVVRDNRFEAGGYLDAAIGQGARAAEFGAGERLDVSGNVADGAATAGLELPGDVRGWRAAFFWHLLGPQEELLVSANTITCSGDKAGDGEAIALDNNHNSFGTRGLAPLLEAARDRVAIAGTLLPRRTAGGDANSTGYVGHWVQVAAGAGVGQSRRIVGVDVDAARTRTILRVAPDFDVVPVAGDSRIAVGRQFWQAIVAGNRIDHRAPPCLKSNRSASRGGGISVWGQSSDSVIARNVQLDTDGIVFQQSFARDGATLQYFLDIRANRIEGEYAAPGVAGSRGIVGSHGAAPDLVPPIAGFGITIADNVLIGARGTRRPAISFPATWYRGPPPHDWRLIDRPLIFGNTLEGGAGIDIERKALVRDARLTGNRCRDVDPELRGGETQARALCAGPAAASCGCSR